MEQIWGFIKRNGYYFMLAVGVAALGALVISYNRKIELADRVNTLQKEQDKIQLIEENEEMLPIPDTAIEEDAQQQVISNNVELDVPQMSSKTNTTKDQTTNEPTTNENENQTSNDNATSEVSKKEKEELHFDTDQPMSWPVVGNVILPFSMDATVYYVTLDQYKTNPGVLIQTIEGTEVTPGAKGRVISVQEESGYGMVITLDLGDGYTAKYGQLAEVRVEEGQSVNANTVIGLAAEPSAFFKKEGCHIFFQISKDEIPQNPMQYLE